MRIAITDGLHPDAIAKLRAECGGEVAELEPESLGSDGGSPTHGPHCAKPHQGDR